MTNETFSYQDFSSRFPVSRETYDRLALYVATLEKWQKSINLISAATLPDLWNRHIIDSFQLVNHISSSEAVLDMGSGGGLPGIILAIAGHRITLVESDGKKVAFLREVSRLLGLDITILHQRIEAVSLSAISTLTARAFAPLSTMVSLLGDNLTTSHRLLLLKGKSYKNELDELEKDYDFNSHIHPSITDPSGVIVELRNIHIRGR